MGRAVTLLGHTCTGHGGFPPRPNDTANNFVFVGGIPVHCVGDHWVVHSDGDSSHDGVLADGSSLWFIGGRAVGLIGSSISCGSAVAEGSDFVFSD